MKYFICILVLLLATSCASPSKLSTTGALHHVGLVWLKQPGNEAHRQRLVDAVHAFLRDIPEVRGVSVGCALPQKSELVDSSFDVCFVMQFDDQDAMDKYAMHASHKKAAEDAFLPLARKIVFYDFMSE